MCRTAVLSRNEKLLAQALTKITDGVSENDLILGYLTRIQEVQAEIELESKLIVEFERCITLKNKATLKGVIHKAHQLYPKGRPKFSSPNRARDQVICLYDYDARFCFFFFTEFISFSLSLSLHI